jgi:hypothetical protein
MAITRRIAAESGRQLVLRFAASLAHLLNRGHPVVELHLFAVYNDLLQVLARRDSKFTTRGRYDVLLGMGLFAGTPREEVAEIYFRLVLQRRLQLARNNHTHQGHRLFEALCHRGAEPAWESAELVRVKDRPTPASDARRPPDFATGVSDRLATFRRKKPFSDDRATKLGARTRRQIAAGKV